MTDPAEESSALMRQGIALLDANTPASLGESLAYFEAAIDLRRDAIAPGDPRAGYLLAASWMNRGDALTRLGTPPALAEALRSYDEALVVLRPVPPEADPLYRRRHAIAWINRGVTLQAQGTGQANADAIHSFEQGTALLCGWPEHSLLLASARVNQGNVFLQSRPVRAAEAQHCAATALELVEGSEENEPLAAEVGLKARLLVCQAVAHRLAEATAPQDAGPLVCTATDAVETGLQLAGRWEARIGKFAGRLPEEFFRFGIAVYRRYQPQFLPEFVLDTLDIFDDPAMFRPAVETLRAEAGKLPADGFASLGTASGQRTLEILRALRLTEQRLQGKDRSVAGDTF